MQKKKRRRRKKFTQIDSVEIHEIATVLCVNVRSWSVGGEGIDVIDVGPID